MTCPRRPRALTNQIPAPIISSVILQNTLTEKVSDDDPAQERAVTG